MIIGKNLILRPIKKTDIDKTIIWRNNLDIIKMAQLVRFPKTHEIEENWFDKILHDTSNRNIYFGIDEIQSKEFIGIIQITEIDYISGTGIWGFIIGDENKRGKGYSVEAPVLFFDYLFNVINLRKIYGYPIVFNKATLGMHQKIGNFIEEGCLKKHVYYENSYQELQRMKHFHHVLL